MRSVFVWEWLISNLTSTVTLTCFCIFRIWITGSRWNTVNLEKKHVFTSCAALRKILKWANAKGCFVFFLNIPVTFCLIRFILIWIIILLLLDVLMEPMWCHGEKQVICVYKWIICSLVLISYFASSPHLLYFFHQRVSAFVAFLFGVRFV